MMTRRAWTYIWSVLLAGAGLSGLAICSDPQVSASEPLTFGMLILLTLLTQFLEAVAPGRNSYYPHLVFLFAGVLLLHPVLFVLLVVVPHLVEWARKRLANSPMLRDWYIQPFNIASHLIAGLAARWLFILVSANEPTVRTPLALLAAVAIRRASVNCPSARVKKLVNGSLEPPSNTASQKFSPKNRFE